MVDTRNQKDSEDKRTTLEVEMHRSPAQNEDLAGHGTGGNRTKQITSESTPVEQGQDFASLTETFDREEMSEMSDISIENPAHLLAIP